MYSSQLGITFTDSRGPVNSDGPIHCIRSLNRMVRYSVMPVCVSIESCACSFCALRHHRVPCILRAQTALYSDFLEITEVYNRFQLILCHFESYLRPPAHFRVQPSVLGQYYTFSSHTTRFNSSSIILNHF